VNSWPLVGLFGKSIAGMFLLYPIDLRGKGAQI
jgi:hypothetical protein